MNRLKRKFNVSFYFAGDSKKTLRLVSFILLMLLSALSFGH